MVWLMRIFPQNSRHHADSEHNQRKPDQALHPMVKPLRQSHMQLENGDAKHDNCECMTQCVGHPQPQSALPVALYSRNIGNRSEMIVVEPVTQPKQKAGAQSGVEFPVSDRGNHEG